MLGTGRVRRRPCCSACPVDLSGLDDRRLCRPGRLGAGGQSGSGEPTATAARTAARSTCAPPAATIEVHGTLTALPQLERTSPGRSTPCPIEQYVADVAPAESPVTWAIAGWRRARRAKRGASSRPRPRWWPPAPTSSRRPLGYGGYADTCDQTCQTYPGMQWENPSTTLAAADTAGQVMDDATAAQWPPRSTRPRRAATSAGAPVPGRARRRRRRLRPGRLQPAPRLDGSVPVSSIEAAYPQIGTLSTITVTSRNGNGDFGGRVHQMTIAGSGGSVSVTGQRVRRRAEPAVRTGSPSAASPAAGSEGTGSTPPTAACSASGTRSSTAAPAACVLNQPVVGHGDHARRRRLLGGGHRRRRVQLRRRPVLRQHRAASG